LLDCPQAGPLFGALPRFYKSVLEVLLAPFIMLRAVLSKAASMAVAAAVRLARAPSGAATASSGPAPPPTPSVSTEPTNSAAVKAANSYSNVAPSGGAAQQKQPQTEEQLRRQPAQYREDARQQWVALKGLDDELFIVGGGTKVHWEWSCQYVQAGHRRRSLKAASLGMVQSVCNGARKRCARISAPPFDFEFK